MVLTKYEFRVFSLVFSSCVFVTRVFRLPTTSLLPTIGRFLTPPSFAQAASPALFLLFRQSFFSLFPWLTHFHNVTSVASPFFCSVSFLKLFFFSLPQFFFLSLTRSCSLLHIFSLPPFFTSFVFFLFPFSVFCFVLSHYHTFSLSNFFPSLTNFFPITSLIIDVIARYLSNISRFPSLSVSF